MMIDDDYGLAFSFLLTSLRTTPVPLLFLLPFPLSPLEGKKRHPNFLIYCLSFKAGKGGAKAIDASSESF